VPTFESALAYELRFEKRGNPSRFESAGSRIRLFDFTGHKNSRPFRPPTARTPVELDDFSRRRPAQGNVNYLQTRRRPPPGAPNPAASPRKSPIRSRHAFLLDLGTEFARVRWRVRGLTRSPETCSLKHPFPGLRTFCKIHVPQATHVP
jgi:hypothetical protein